MAKQFLDETGGFHLTSVLVMAQKPPWSPQWTTGGGTEEGECVPVGAPRSPPYPSEASAGLGGVVGRPNGKVFKHVLNIII